MILKLYKIKENKIIFLNNLNLYIKSKINKKKILIIKKEVLIKKNFEILIILKLKQIKIKSKF